MAGLPIASAPAGHRSRAGSAAARPRSPRMAAAQDSRDHRGRNQRQGFGERFCAAIMAAAGFRVGTFTSPHLRDYRERIRIHDRLVSAAELVAAFERIEAARGEVGLTFFEFNTLAALLVFDAAELDAWVLEIGMGGRLDAVNVVDPDVAVVVSIGFDHQEYLGATLEAIAREKAGIFRQGRPAVLGSREMPGVVEEMARLTGAPLKRLGAEYHYTLGSAGWHFRGRVWDLARLPAPALIGDAQYANAATAIAALEEIDARLAIPAAAVAQGLAQVRLAGRFQVIAPAAMRPRGYWMSRTTRPRRACWRAICATTRTADEPWRCAGFCPTRTHRASWRNCATASMRGGAYPPTESEAAAELPWRKRLCRRLRRLSKQRKAHLRDARPHWPMQIPRIEFSCSALSTWSDPHLIGSKQGTCCHRPLFPNILRRPEPLTFKADTSSMDRRVKERLVGASILVVLIVLIVPELLSGPPSAGPGRILVRPPRRSRSAMSPLTSRPASRRRRNQSSTLPRRVLSRRRTQQRRAWPTPAPTHPTKPRRAQPTTSLRPADPSPRPAEPLPAPSRAHRPRPLKPCRRPQDRS